MEQLACQGGKPVRKNPFPSNFLGVALYGKEELAELTDVVTQKSPFRHYGIGTSRKTKDFEENIKAYFGSKYTLAVSSGTGALFCAAAALSIGPGDEVILPTFNWFSDYYAITNFGALPVFADIDETLSLDPADFERKISSATKAVIIITFQGYPPKMDAIMEIANRHGIKVIEDIAQGFGAEYKGKKLGTFGDIAIASFQQNKVLSCGEGGVLLTNKDEYFIRAVRYHDLGFMRPLFENQVEDKQLLAEDEAFASNQYRMGELAGAVMLAQLGKLEFLLKTCRAYHKRIRDSFSANPHFTIRWVEGDLGIAVLLQFGTPEEANHFQECLSAEGIPVGPKSACRNLMTQYPVQSKRLSHPALPPFGKGFSGESVDYRKLNDDMKTDGILARMVAISIGPIYTDDDISDIINAMAKVTENMYRPGGGYVCEM